MSRPTKIEKNCTTGEELIVELTDEEIADIEALHANSEARRIAQEAEAERVTTLKTSAKAKLIAGEPLTEDEAAVIVL
jgi:hypothetical protein